MESPEEKAGCEVLETTQQLLETTLPEVRVTHDFDVLADSVFHRTSSSDNKQADDVVVVNKTEDNGFTHWRPALTSMKTNSVASDVLNEDDDENVSPNAYFDSPVGVATAKVDDVFLSSMEALSVYSSSPHVNNEERKRRLIKQAKEESPLMDGSMGSPMESSLNSSSWFDNTNDEIILYERYGDNYKDVVDAMSLEEKKTLKREIQNSVPSKTIQQLQAEAEEEQEGLHSARESEEERKLEVESLNVEDNSVKKGAVCSPTPKPRTRTPSKVKKFSPRSISHPETLKMLEDELIAAMSRSPSKKEDEGNEYSDSEDDEVHDDVDRAEEDDKEGYQDSLKPTIPSSTRVITEMKTAEDALVEGKGTKPFDLSPEQRNDRFLKRLRTPDLPSYLRPTSASKRRASPRKDPITLQTREASMCCKYVPPKDDVEALRRKMRQKAPSSIYGRKIISPVAQYIHDNPVPLRHRKNATKKKTGARQLSKAFDRLPPSNSSRDEEQKQQARGETHIKDLQKECVASPSRSLKYSELPEKQYVSPKVAVEVREQGSPLRNKNSPQVVRHVGRGKVPSSMVSCQQKNDNNEESVDTEASVDMSLHAVRDVCLANNL